MVCTRFNAVQYFRVFARKNISLYSFLLKILFIFVFNSSLAQKLPTSFGTEEGEAMLIFKQNIMVSFKEHISEMKVALSFTCQHTTQATVQELNIQIANPLE